MTTIEKRGVHSLSVTTAACPACAKPATALAVRNVIRIVRKALTSPKKCSALTTL